MRIALVSDTHVPASIRRLPGSLLTALEGVDRILHAGDLVQAAVLEQLDAIAPTTAVTGNMDPPELKGKLRDREILEVAGRTIGLAHGHQPHSFQDRYIAFGFDDPEFDLFYEAMVTQLPGAEIVVFGHFHKPLVKRWNDVLFVNPGSIAPPHRRPTYALLDLDDGIDVRVIELDREHGT